MPRIGKFPAFGKRFFRLAKKLVGHCHFQHLWRVVVALAGMQGRHSLRRMQSLFQDRRTRQAMADFLKKAAWDAPEVLRQQALDMLKQLGCRAGETVSVLLDDTQKQKRGRKMDALKKIFLHAEKVYATGHTMLGAALVFRGVVIPFRISLWAPKEFCEASQAEPDSADHVTFRKLTELAADALDAVGLPNGVKGIVLFDSYYLCPTVTKACLRQGFRWISVSKKNRKFAPDGRGWDPRKIGRYGQNVLRRDGRSEKVRGKRYRLAERVGQLSKIGRVKLVLSRRPKETAWVALTTNETRWSKKTVLTHYLSRWGIEVLFKMSKQHLGLGDYQLLRYRGIERYLCLVLIAHLLLTHLALKGVDAQAKLDKKDLKLPSVPKLQEQLRGQLWDDIISGLESGTRHKAAAKKIKQLIQL
ncbi:MAG: transposase [Planctomycetaceae bacterium]|nr:transposase [Planctomycetaceae bacterium]